MCTNCTVPTKATTLNSDGDEDVDGELSRRVQRVKPSDSSFQLQRELRMDFQCQVRQAQGGKI